MNEVNGTKWKILVVEDKDNIANEVLEAIPNFVTSPDTAEGHPCRSFKEAINRLEDERFDVLILDLKDDSESGLDEHDVSAGLRVFDSLKRIRFLPVVFYTAHPYKVRKMQTSFVRVVEKTDGISKLKEEVGKVLATQLPALSRRIEEIQRDYLWDFVSNHWQEFDNQSDQSDLAYLLARRLAVSLEMTATELAATVGGQKSLSASEQKAHPMVMYVRPALGPHRLAGDILVEQVNGLQSYWLILTPSCDFAQDKVHNVVMAKCERLKEQNEFTKWSSNPDHKDSKSRLEDLIGDNRKTERDGPKIQPERFKFLPGTFFLPDIVVDFQQLRSVPVKDLDQFEVVASLDSPFAEAILARFSRYFGRLGTPDIDKQIVLNRLQAAQAQNSTQTNTGKNELSEKE